MPLNRSTTAWKKSIGEVLLLGVGVLLVYWLLAPDSDGPPQPVTLADLSGVWTTTDPRYVDRFLQFDAGGTPTITFGQGRDGSAIYTIDRIDSQATKEGVWVQLRYIDLASAAFRFNFFYLDQGDGIAWIKNRHGVYWSRAAQAPAGTGR